MKKIICKILEYSPFTIAESNHKWRWLIAREKIVCVRCGLESGETITQWEGFYQKPLKSV